MLKRDGLRLGDNDDEAGAGARTAEGVVVRTYRPQDRGAIARLYSDGLLKGDVDPDESTGDLDNPHAAYFSRPDDRLWVAEWAGRIVGMVGVIHIDHHVAQIRRLRVDPAFRGSELPRRLLKVVLDHCRRCGDLKLVLDTHVEEHQEALAACSDGGFQYTRARRNGGRARLEFYLNLYQRPRVTAKQEQPHRAPYPPRIRRMSV